MFEVLIAVASSTALSNGTNANWNAWSDVSAASDAAAMCVGCTDGRFFPRGPAYEGGGFTDSWWR